MPLQATSGAASYDAFGGGVPFEPVYIESIFQTWLYTGNGSTQTINNGIDLAGKGGFVWLKSRSASGTHALFDTARGATKKLYSNLTNAEFTDVTSLTSFNSNGFSIGIDQSTDATTYVSWTFREQPKFFDVVTWTGDGNSTRNISHNLGSVPGFIIIKRTNFAQDWLCVARNSSGTYFRGSTTTFGLNTTNAAAGTYDFVGNGQFTSTEFALQQLSAAGSTVVNENGATYVAYLFAHNAGGFGLSGTDNVISCGSFTSDGSGNASVNLGYEPQFVILKSSSATGNWNMFDVMREMSQTNTNWLIPNTSGAENSLGGRWMIPNATGFSATNGNLAISTTYIYIAIRRGPMRVPTTGTSVFDPEAYSGNGANNRAFTTGFVPDMVWWKSRSNATDWGDATLLAGINRGLILNATDGESSAAGYYINTYNNTGFTYGTSDVQYNGSGRTYVFEAFSRAPGFFDVVCYTGNGTAGRTITHNLTVAPEMMIVKARDFSGGRPWPVYHIGMGNTKFMYLNTTDAEATNTWWNDTTPTASVFTVGSNSVVNFSGTNYVAYLFASCPGVSKVGSFTGTGATQVINCGFTAGARFVLIKATSTTGNWLVWDSARGIVAGNDPYLVLNSTAAEVTNTDWVDTAATGFELSNAGGNLANSNGVSYVFFAVA